MSSKTVYVCDIPNCSAEADWSMFRPGRRDRTGLEGIDHTGAMEFCSFHAKGLIDDPDGTLRRIRGQDASDARLTHR